MNFEIANKEVKLEKECTDLATQARNKNIVTVDDHETGLSILSSIDKFKKSVKEVFDPIIKAQHDAHKLSIQKRDAILEPVDKAESILKPKMRAFQRKIDEEKLALIAAAKAEEERLRKIAEEKNLEAAIKAEENGANPQTVDMIANHVPPISVKPDIPELQFDKRKFKDSYKFEVVNLDSVPREYLKIDESKVKAQIKATGLKTNISGIRVYIDNF